MLLSKSPGWVIIDSCLEIHEKMANFHVLPFLIIYHDKPVLKMKIAT